MIRVDQVSYGYHQTPVLDHVTLYESEPVISAIWGGTEPGRQRL